MPKTIALRHPPSRRRQRLLSSESTSTSIRFAEVAGGTTAECAAICCCCPCGLVNLLLLFIYKLPAGLCRRALRKKRRQRLIKMGLFPSRRRLSSTGFDDTDMPIDSVVKFDLLEIKSPRSEESEREVVELEKEMWDRFRSTGFWRSPSQRESIPKVNN